MEYTQDNGCYKYSRAGATTGCNSLSNTKENVWFPGVNEHGDTAVDNIW
jgi:hypothetical protein